MQCVPLRWLGALFEALSLRDLSMASRTKGDLDERFLNHLLKRLDLAPESASGS